MVDINLLPEEKKPSKGALEISKLINKLVLLSIVALVFLIVVGVGVYFIYSYKINDLQKKQEVAKQEINNLENSEQKLVLIRDRLSKIEYVINNYDKVGDAIPTLDQAFTLTQPPNEMVELVMNDKGAEFTFVTDSSASMGRLIATLVESGKFKKIELVSFEYSAKFGYEFVLSLN